MRIPLLSAFLASLLGLQAFGQEAPARPLPWTQLSRATCNVDGLQEKHPERDGRGVVVAVLDTGVDPSVAGLTTLPGGGVKVVDIQDFSGQGDVSLEPVALDSAGRLMRFARDGAPTVYTQPPGLPEGSRLYFGRILEKTFRGSSVEDINDDGDTTGEFGVLVVAPKGGGDGDARVYVDTDRDRSFADERGLANYRQRHDTFTFARRKAERQTTPLTCSVNVFLAKRLLSVCYDDGGHGTHVAGIAAGYGLLGQKGFNGVAPGAAVISLKIGDGRLGGGATTTGSMMRAFRYAARYAREHQVHVVCNLSFGIESELEGWAAIDESVDDLCRANPGLVICTSAGNSGPGLSTVGTPAAARYAIAVAALLAKDTARDVMGATLPTHRLAVFSSRGGELAKPDLATPGYATSSVPRWSRWGDFWSGTSMASPYAAGLSACLLSGYAYDAVAPIYSSWVKTALKKSATPLPDATALDQGAGVPDVLRATGLLAKAIEEGAKTPLFEHTVTTVSPHAPNARGPAAYWRLSGPLPASARTQVFTVKPVFAPGLDANARTAFSRRYTLRSDQPWLRPQQEQFYLRGEQSADVRVGLDRTLLSKPGLYVGTVAAVGHDDVDLRFQATVIVPHRFDAKNERRLRLQGTAKGWIPDRIFVAVPPGASAMHLTLRAPDGSQSTARAPELFSPDGSVLTDWTFRLDTEGGRRVARWTVSDALRPGVWEVCISSVRPGDDSPWDLGVRFSGVAADPQTLDEWEGEPNETVSLTLTNRFDRSIRAIAEGSIEGVREVIEDDLTAFEDTLKLPVGFTEGVKALRIRVEFSRADFALFTDVALTVTDSDGKVIAQDAMGGRTVTLKVDRPSGASDGSLSLGAAFTSRFSASTARVTVTTDAIYEESIPVTIEHKSEGRFVLYPGVPCRLEATLKGTLPELSDGSTHFGRVRIRDAASREVVQEVGIER
jgi:tripeptidyl-peptidase II